VIVNRLELRDFRNYRHVDLDLHAGVTAILGPNGHGKTSLVEALSVASTLRSFRGVPNEALIRDGADAAIVRVQARHEAGREILIEVKLSRTERTRVLVNRQRPRRHADVAEALRMTVFSPDDLDIVKDGPGLRRDYLDAAMVALEPFRAETIAEVERVVRQRGALLKQCGGRLGSSESATLDVWDERLVEHGTVLGKARRSALETLTPLVSSAYEDLAGVPSGVSVGYRPEWLETGLAAALVDARHEDLRRATTSVGPHRDDVLLEVGGLAARTHRSQGEQRTLALALRLAVHRAVIERTGEAPVLVLDDVLSELDDGRSEALVRNVPPGQVLITSASRLPSAAEVDTTVHVHDGALVG